MDNFTKFEPYKREDGSPGIREVPADVTTESDRMLVLMLAHVASLQKQIDNAQASVDSMIAAKVANDPTFTVQTLTQTLSTKIIK